MPAKAKAARKKAAVPARKASRRKLPRKPSRKVHKKMTGQVANPTRRDRELHALRAYIVEVLSLLREIHAALSDPAVANRLRSEADPRERA